MGCHLNICDLTSGQVLPTLFATMMALKVGSIIVVKSMIKSLRAMKVGCTKVNLRRTTHSTHLISVFTVHDEGPYERKTQFANDIANWILDRAN